MSEEERKINVSINEGDAFYAHETSVQFGPTQFVLDFKSITPRIDMRSRDAPVLAMRHNVVLLEPYGAKRIADMLSKIVKKYEKRFGKIEKSEALKKYEHQSSRAPGKKKEDATTYFG